MTSWDHKLSESPISHRDAAVHQLVRFSLARRVHLLTEGNNREGGNLQMLPPLIPQERTPRFSSKMSAALLPGLPGPPRNGPQGGNPLRAEFALSVLGPVPRNPATYMEAVLDM